MSDQGQVKVFDKETLLQVKIHATYVVHFVEKLSEALGVDISAGGVRSIWLRNNMNTTALRVEKSNALAESA
ncbi:hypothetical protein [Alteromonas sp. 14N.309.X.WAT.G.H12]|uniref:hypothetical protein n=1 Tax=Alteromonas sp. 14N.309.X.WAT.G.H12 TaxID=3120824 RepID=UPI002FD0C273